VVPLAGRGEAVEDGGRLAAGITACEEIVFSSGGDAFDALFIIPPLFSLFMGWFCVIPALYAMVSSSVRDTCDR
jgi:hypothetical protein